MITATYAMHPSTPRAEAEAIGRACGLRLVLFADDAVAVFECDGPEQVVLMTSELSYGPESVSGSPR